jgi:ABC-type phosphate/phosphonate transport system substrate-binding protein
LSAVHIASLPMYDLPEVREATDALWRGLARRLALEGLSGVPEALVREGPHEAPWSDPALLFSQSCGYPVTHEFAGKVRLVATPRYRAPGCEGSSYRSVIVVGASSPASALGDLRGAVCAINEPSSHSGMNALRALIAPLSGGRPFFASVRRSGAHLASLAMVGSGEADVASIDGVTYALAARARSELVRGTRPLAWSAPAPACPYVTRGDAGDDLVARIQRALACALRDPDLAWARDELLLDGIEVLPAEAYDVILEREREAARLCYATLL